MLEVIQTDVFQAWLSKLRDTQARIRIQIRIDRFAMGNAGDVRPVGSGVSELRIDYGPGYRVYFKRIDGAVVLLLCGGDKRTQDADIKRAIAIASNWK